MEASNTLAYHVKATNMDLQSFKVQAPDFAFILCKAVAILNRTYLVNLPVGSFCSVCMTRLGQKGMSAPKVLAHYFIATNMDLQSFKVQAPDFAFILYKAVAILNRTYLVNLPLSLLIFLSLQD